MNHIETAQNPHPISELAHLLIIVVVIVLLWSGVKVAPSLGWDAWVTLSVQGLGSRGEGGQVGSSADKQPKLTSVCMCSI